MAIFFRPFTETPLLRKAALPTSITIESFCAIRRKVRKTRCLVHSLKAMKGYDTLRAITLIRAHAGNGVRRLVDEIRKSLSDAAGRSDALAPHDQLKGEPPELSQFWDYLRVVVALRTRQIGLTPREEQVLCCLLIQLRDKEIAHALGLSTSTVKGSVHRLLAKVGARSRYQLARKILPKLSRPGQPLVILFFTSQEMPLQRQ
jgi:DNA-binding NarL/FixJ family response regulator